MSPPTDPQRDSLEDLLPTPSQRRFKTVMTIIMVIWLVSTGLAALLLP